MLRIYLIRHAESEDNAAGILSGRRDSKLTTRGLSQALALATFLEVSGIRPDISYTSPQWRAKQTAEIVMDALKLPAALCMDALRERDFGMLTGMHKSEAALVDTGGVIIAGRRSFAIAPKGAETFPDLLRRADRVLEHIQALHADGDILLFSHCISGLMLFCQYHQLEWEEVLKDYHFGNASVTLLAPDVAPQHATIYEPTKKH